MKSLENATLDSEYIVMICNKVTIMEEEVVRCGNCAYCEVEGATFLKRMCRKWNAETKENGFCHMGAKRV